MNKKQLIDCIQLCINSYGGKHGKSKKVLDKVRKFEKKNIEYYIGTKGKTLFIIYRGTDEAKDWIQNFETKGLDIDKGEIHLGFYEDYIATKDDIFKVTKGYDKIVITGHSKGSDQAILLYYFLKKYAPHKDIQCVAVAPAKCMSRHFKNKLKDIYTIINGEDMVCKIPQWRYKHHGKIIRIGKRNPLFWIPVIRVIGAWIYHWPLEYLKNMKAYKKMIP